MLIEIKSKVSMPEGVKIYQGDNNVDDILVTVDRFYGQYDLADFNAYLKIKYVDDSCNQILLKTVVEEPKKLVLEAKIDKNLTRYAGQISCQPYFSNDDTSLCFNASPFNLEIEPSIEAYETIEQELLPGTLVVLEAELKLAKKELEDTLAKTDLGEVDASNVESLLNTITQSGMARFTAVYENGVKEPRYVINNKISDKEARQTMISADEKGYFTKISTRKGYYGVMNVWEIWEENYLATRSYVDTKIAEIKGLI